MTSVAWQSDHVRDARTKVTLALLALQAFDLWITFKVLNLGGTELNPAAKVLIGLGLIIPIKLGVAALALWKAQYGKPSKHKWNNLPELPAFGIACFVLGVYALVVILNVVTYYSYA